MSDSLQCGYLPTVNQGELDVLYRFHELGARARAQALHLNPTRASYVLREYVSQQKFAEVGSLDEVEAMLRMREADQSARTVRLRELAGGEWRDIAAQVRKSERDGL